MARDFAGIGDWKEVVHNKPQWREAIRPALHPHEDKEKNGWMDGCGCEWLGMGTGLLVWHVQHGPVTPHARALFH